MSSNKTGGQLDLSSAIVELKSYIDKTVSATHGNSKFSDSIDVVSASANKEANALKNVNNNLSPGVKNYNNLEKATVKVNSGLKSQNNLLEKSKYSWSKAFESFSMYLSVTTVFYTAVSAIKSMVDEVIALDSALVDLQKVSDLSGKSLEKFVSKAYEVAAEVANTGSEVINASTEFSKAGYSEDDVLNLGKLALVYKNVADEQISAADSASFMIAQMKAFNIEANKAVHIIDSVNEVSNKYAVSSSDISENLGKASASLSASNTTYEQSLGLKRS